MKERKWGATRHWSRSTWIETRRYQPSFIACKTSHRIHCHISAHLSFLTDTVLRCHFLNLGVHYIVSLLWSEDLGVHVLRSMADTLTASTTSFPFRCDDHSDRRVTTRWGELSACLLRTPYGVQRRTVGGEMMLRRRRVWASAPPITHFPANEKHLRAKICYLIMLIIMLI